MDPFLHQYQTRLEVIMLDHDYLILDNIFPVPLHRKGKEWALDDIPEISLSTALAAWWERVLQKESEKIVIPREIYRKALQGYGIVTQSRRNLPSSHQENRSILEEYLGTEYSLLSETRKHIFRPALGEYDRYASVVAQFKEMVLEYHLKKENHHDDKGADESLAAAASYLSMQRSARCAIITNDGDIDRIVHRCLSESEKKLVMVYHPPRLDNHSRYRSLADLTYTPNSPSPSPFRWMIPRRIFSCNS